MPALVRSYRQPIPPLHYNRYHLHSLSSLAEMMELPAIALASCDQDLQSVLWSLSEDSNTLPGNHSLEPSVSVQWWSLTAPTNSFIASPFIQFLIYNLHRVVVENKHDWTAAHTGKYISQYGNCNQNRVLWCHCAAAYFFWLFFCSGVEEKHVANQEKPWVAFFCSSSIVKMPPNSAKTDSIAAITLISAVAYD